MRQDERGFLGLATEHRSDANPKPTEITPGRQHDDKIYLISRQFA
jgi:hypothetical protein